MGLQEVKKKKKKKQLVQSTRVEDRHGHHHHKDGSKVWVLGLSGADIAAALPLPQLKPVKTGRRRHAAAGEEEEEEEEEEPVTPTGEEWRIPAEATTCPPAPKKPRTAVSIIRGTATAAAGRRCNCDGGGEVIDEFFRVPADLEAVFVARAAKAN